jgi:hypothetical protein
MMLVGVVAPLGVAVRDRPRRLKKPLDFEDAEIVLVGVVGLDKTCCAATLSKEPWRDDALEADGVSYASRPFGNTIL